MPDDPRYKASKGQRYKVVNRHGQKPVACANHFYYAPNAQLRADQLNAQGFDDGPFTVAEWGEVQGWYGVEGHNEARVERGEEPE